jgi:hypothetical protein
MNKFIKLLIGRYKFYALTLLSTTTLLTCHALVAPSLHNHSEIARSASSFIDSLGINVHLSYLDTNYADYEDLVKPKLQELGIRHIRDNGSYTQPQLDKLNNLASIGIKSTLIMDPIDIGNASNAVNIVKAAAAVEAIEGQNEWDVHPDRTYKGQNFPQGVRQFQAELYSAIKGNSTTAHLDVLSPSLAFPKNAFKLGHVACDIGNMHSYPDAKEVASNVLDKWLFAARIVCSTKKAIIATETGYQNAVNRRGVSEQASAKYLPRLLLEYFNRRIKRTYLYELIDLKPNPEADMGEWHFGLLRNDGSPKPAFIALKNLISLLENSNVLTSKLFTVKSLNYTLGGNTSNIHHTLLQKRDGRFYLIIWQEVLSFNIKTDTDIVVPESQITLTLNTLVRKAATYRPLNSITPLVQYINPRQLKLMLPDDPLVIELVPD